MVVPRLLATALWLIATMASTAIVWTATSTVAADVTDRPPPVIDHREVVSELQSGSRPPAPSTTSTTRRPSTPTSAVRPPTTAVPPTAPATAPPAPQTTQPLPPTTTAPVTPTTPPTTQAASRPTATYSTSGGVVRVACDGFFIQLISATPNDGWAAVVVARGPVNVEVHFIRYRQDVPVKVVCFGQPIRYYEDDVPVFGGGS